MAISTNLTKVFALAGQESAAYGLIAVDHVTMMAGFLRAPQCDAAQILEHFGVSLDPVRGFAERKFGRQRDANLMSDTSKVRGASGSWTFDDALFEAYEHANAHASALGHKETDTAHLLLTLVSDGRLNQLFSELRVSVPRLIQVIDKYLNVGGSSAQSANLKTAKDFQGVLEPAGSVSDSSLSTTQKEASKTPILDEFGRDLTRLARENKLNPLVGRSKEVARALRILGRRTKRNPLFIGEPGVGKTAIGEGIAARIAAGEVPACLRDKRVIELELATLVAGTKYRGEFEERMKNVVKEAIAEGAILFIDELHTMIGGGGAVGGLDASNILKPALSRGEIIVIGATTLGEYRKHFQKDAALDRRFQPIRIEAATIAETIEILKGLRPGLESHHKVAISDLAIVAAARLSDRYIGDRFLPDKAIDLIDEAASALSIANPQPDTEKAPPPPPPPTMLQRVLRANPIRILLPAPKADPVKGPKRPELSSQDVAELISEMTGVPVGDMEQSERDLLLNLESTMAKSVVGQKPAISAVAQAMRRARAGLRDPNKPAGSFLFVGPTGVGKTEVAKVLQRIRTGNSADLVRIDMSEYMEKHSVSRLIGSPPGYVGYEEGGVLTEAVRNKPYCVVLFDEIEKAHPDVFNILLQVMDDGRLTDGHGRTVDFRNVILIMTSNAGTEVLDKNPVGFNANFDAIKDRVLEAIKGWFRPEFLNRIDEVVCFSRLLREEIEQVAEILMSDLKGRLKSEHSIDLTIDKSGMDLLVAEGYDKVYGARPLKRAIQRLVENPLADAIIEGRKVKAGAHLVAVVKDKVLDFVPFVSPAVAEQRTTARV
jgi:ATP-dependent Clp protease ATP-binding subunit ClpC